MISLSTAAAVVAPIESTLLSLTLQMQVNSGASSPAPSNHSAPDDYEYIEPALPGFSPATTHLLQTAADNLAMRSDDEISCSSSAAASVSGSDIHEVCFVPTLTPTS